MNREKITVIIPTYNRSKLLERALKSAINQSYTDIEIIIVDDSDDNEERIKNKKRVEELNDKRVVYLVTNGKEGGGKARNMGIKVANGGFIAFLDDDDVWFKEKLRIELQKIKNEEKVGIVYCDYILYNNEEKVVAIVKNRKKGCIYQDLLLSFCVGETSSTLIKKDVFDNIGYFDESLPANQEYDLYIRIAEKYKFDYVPEPLLKKYHYNQRISSDFNKKVKGLKLLHKKHKSRYKKLNLGLRTKIKAKYLYLLFIFSLGKVIGESAYFFINPFKRFK